MIPQCVVSLCSTKGQNSKSQRSRVFVFLVVTKTTPFLDFYEYWGSIGVISSYQPSPPPSSRKHVDFLAGFIANWMRMWVAGSDKPEKYAEICDVNVVSILRRLRGRRSDCCPNYVVVKLFFQFFHAFFMMSEPTPVALIKPPPADKFTVMSDRYRSHFVNLGTYRGWACQLPVAKSQRWPSLPRDASVSWPLRRQIWQAVFRKVYCYRTALGNWKVSADIVFVNR
jgi:hypothetical protein